jgi:dipeptidyl aminopeptidase/acylaminoacyl peptidase
MLGFNRADTALYMLDSRGRNTAALVRVDPATGRSELIGTSEQADVDNVIRDPRTLEPVAYSVNYLRREWTPLNAEIGADLEYLRSRLPGEISIVSMTEDGRRAVVQASAAERPAAFYLYDRGERNLRLLFETRPDLANYQLQPMHPVAIRSRDRRNLVSYLTLPPGSDTNGDGRPERPVPMVLYVHGGPWARDQYGYNSAHQWLANRGYAVLSVNYRGSTGFGKDFINSAVGQWSGAMHEDLIDSVDWAVAQGVTRRNSVAIMGGSYGGYATLVGLTFTPDRFRCGVDIVGPSNLVTLMESFPAYWRPILAGTFYRHIGDPATPEGRARAMAQSPITRVDRIRVPLLIGQGQNDPRVVKAESDQIAAAMRQRGPPVTYVNFPDEGHGFARPPNSMSFFAITEAFLQPCLGGRFQPIGDDFTGSSLQVLEGVEHVPGLRDALARRASQAGQ